MKTTVVGAGTVIDGRSSVDLHVADVQVVNSAAFTGRLIDLAATRRRGENRYIGGIICPVDLDKAITCTIRNNSFGGDIAIRGKSVNGNYSNAHVIEGNTFNGCTTMPIRNPGEDWLVQGNTFEPLGAGGPGAIDHGARGFTAKALDGHR